MDFAARLRIAIFQKGKTQKWLAKTIGVAEQTVSRWCNDDKVPNLNVISAICDALDVSADWLIRGKNESDKSCEVLKSLKSDITRTNDFISYGAMQKIYIPQDDVLQQINRRIREREG